MQESSNITVIIKKFVNPFFWKSAFTLLTLTVFLIFAGGCSKEEKSVRITYTHYTVNKKIKSDEKVENFILKYRKIIQKKAAKVIGMATCDMEKGKPESALGNLLTDILREVAGDFLGKEVDVAILNNGGIRRKAISKGPIRVKDIFELMPFNNKIVVLYMRGKDLKKLAQQIAKINGTPQSGMEIVFKNRRPVKVSVGGKPIDDTKIYTVATTGYLYGVGGKFSVLKKAIKSVNTKILLRDAIIDYIKKKKKICAKVEGRTVRLK